MGSRDAEERIKLVWAFFHLFIYMEIMYFLLFFSLFAPFGHLRVSVSLTILYRRLKQLDYITTDIWKVCKFLANLSFPQNRHQE